MVRDQLKFWGFYYREIWIIISKLSQFPFISGALDVSSKDGGDVRSITIEFQKYDSSLYSRIWVEKSNLIVSG